MIYKVSKFGKISIKHNKCESGYLYEIVDVSKHELLGYLIKLNAETLKYEGSTETNNWDVFVPIILPTVNSNNISITHLSENVKGSTIKKELGEKEPIDLGILKGYIYFLGASRTLEHHLHIDIEGVDSANIMIYQLKELSEDIEYIKRYLKTVVLSDGFGAFGKFINIEFLDNIKPLHNIHKPDIHTNVNTKPSFMLSAIDKEVVDKKTSSILKRFNNLFKKW